MRADRRLRRRRPGDVWRPVAAIALCTVLAVVAIDRWGSAETQSRDVAVRHVAVGGRPSAAVYRDGIVWVADDGEGRTWRVDARSGAVLDSRRTGRSPVGIAAGRTGVWVADTLGGAVVWVPEDEDEAVHAVELGGSPVGVTVADGVIWVADPPGGRLHRVDERTRRVLGAVTVPGGAVRVAAGHGAVWVSNSERTATRVDSVRLEAGEAVATGLGPIGLVVAAGTLWVANSDDGTVSRLDARTGEARGEAVRVPGRPVAIAAHGGVIWVVSQDERMLTRLDEDTGEVLGSTALAVQPRAVAVSDEGAWVAGVDPEGIDFVPFRSD